MPKELLWATPGPATLSCAILLGQMAHEGPLMVPEASSTMLQNTSLSYLALRGVVLVPVLTSFAFFFDLKRTSKNTKHGRKHHSSRPTAAMRTQTHRKGRPVSIQSLSLTRSVVTPARFPPVSWEGEVRDLPSLLMRMASPAPKKSPHVTDEASRICCASNCSTKSWQPKSPSASTATTVLISKLNPGLEHLTAADFFCIKSWNPCTAFSRSPGGSEKDALKCAVVLQEPST
mmetsp:Transcript_2064/g.4659  ORF Transcript_2064/g.4659 Transcript_2064/m.4659 type:complete len:232 (+) Transcript_2064:2218-2913(+)